MTESEVGVLTNMYDTEQGLTAQGVQNPILQCWEDAKGKKPFTQSQPPETGDKIEISLPITWWMENLQEGSRAKLRVDWQGDSAFFCAEHGRT